MESNLLSIWVKSPQLKGSNLVIVSECLKFGNLELFKRITNGKVALLVCPEREGVLYYGKIATIIKCNEPKLIEVYTVDGSPHCFQVHAAINEAEFILGKKLNKRHYVIVNMENIIEIDPDVVRISRYLHIVHELLSKYPEVKKLALEKLKSLSIEYRTYLTL